MEFVKAVVAYQKKVDSITKVPKSLKLDEELEQKRKVINHSFSLARDVYERCNNIRQLNESGLQEGVEFLESNLAFNLLLENRLRQAGTTKNNATEMFDGERERSVRAMMAKMTIQQLSDLDLFHRMRGRICSEMLLEKKQLQNVNEYHP
nr:putative glutamine amidotransferase GAT1_2.1 [Tanacetum cinerariifolium]